MTDPARVAPSASSRQESGDAVADLNDIESEIEQSRRRAFSWRKLAAQFIGCVIGLALVAWLVHRAMRDPEVFDRLRAADPRLVVALLLCGVASLVLNGLIFWLAARPIRQLGVVEMQWVNALAAMLNYAPVRLGVFLRLVWALRVDRMRLREVAAWFASVTYTVIVPLGAAIVASIVTGRLGLGLLIIASAIVVAGGVVAPWVARRPIVERRAGGLERVLTSPISLWGSLALRSIDLVLWAARMMLAVEILGMELTLSQSFMLAMAGLAISLNPLGRLGFREATVAFIAARMLGGEGDDLLARSSQLAVVESAGEFIVTVPAGVLAAIMVSRRWRAAARTSSRARGA